MAPSIKLAAQFCTLWSRGICFRGSRCTGALPTSSLLVTNACMIVSVAAAVRYCLVLEMLQRWNIADLHTAVTCDSIAISASNWTPRLRTLWVTLTKQTSTRKAYSWIFFNCWAEPNTIISVFESFNFKGFVFIAILNAFNSRVNVILSFSVM